MKFGEQVSFLALQIDHFEGTECLLLLSTEDEALSRTGKRLLSQLYRKELRDNGGRGGKP